MKKFASLFLVATLGCMHPATTFEEHLPRTKQELESILLEDVKDSRIDMPYERAVLIASEAPPEILRHYEAEIEKLTQQARERLAGREFRNDYEKAREIFNMFREQFIAEDNLYQPWFTLTTKRGNCISLSILFDIVCSRQGIETGYMSTLTHVFNYVEEPRTYIDVTRENGNPGKEYLKDWFLREASREDILAQLYTWRAKRLFNTEEIEEAEEMMKRALVISPGEEQALDNIILFYMLRGRKRDILPYLNQYIKYHPSLPGLYVTRAEIQMFEGNFKEALQDFREAYSLSPDEYIKERIGELERIQ